MNTIITGDALTLIPNLSDQTVQLVVTSPPYPGQYGNTMQVTEWLEWLLDWTSMIHNKLTPNGVLVLNVAFKRMANSWFNTQVLRIPYYLGGLRPLDIYIYGKANPPPNGALTYCDPPGWEFIFVVTKAANPNQVIFNPVRKPYSPKSITKRNGRLYSNMSGQETAPHPDGARQTTLLLMTMSGDQNRPRAKGISFPRALADRFIRQYTNPGDLVLDPFCGVGTTCYVAQQLDRRYIGFEIDSDEADRARAWLRESAHPEAPNETPSSR